MITPTSNAHPAPLAALTLALLGFLALFGPAPAQAHALGEDYVVVRFLESGIEGHFEIHFHDISHVFGIELDSGAGAAIDRVRDTADTIKPRIIEGFSIAPEGGEAYPLVFTHEDITELKQGSFAQYHFRIDSGPLPDRLEIRHDLFVASDPTHRGLFLVEFNAKTDETFPPEYTALVFGPTNPVQTLDLLDVPGLLTPGQMIAQGVKHFWTGIAHVLFLLVLLLPTVLVRRDEQLRPAPSVVGAAIQMLAAVATFCIALALGLLLAATGAVDLSPNVVSVAIALSIAIMAAANLAGLSTKATVPLILVFGIFHGFGLSKDLEPLAFRMVDLQRTLIGFTFGVGLGLLALVLVVFPVLVLRRTAPSYQPMILRTGSIILALIGGAWLIARLL